MPKETTNVMTLSIKPGKQVRIDPPQLRVLADKKVIILRADPANDQDIEVTFDRDPDTVFVKGEIPNKIVVQKGAEVRLPIRQDLDLDKGGTFADEHKTKLARGINLTFVGFKRATQGDHSDIHIEC